MKIARYVDPSIVEIHDEVNGFRWCISQDLIYCKGIDGHEVTIKPVMLKELEASLVAEKKQCNSRLRRKDLDFELRQEIRKELRIYRKQLEALKTANVSGWEAKKEST